MISTRVGDTRVWFEGEEVPGLHVTDHSSRLPFEVRMALVEAGRTHRGIFIEVFAPFPRQDAQAIRDGRPAAGTEIRLEVIEPSLGHLGKRVEYIEDEEDFLPTLHRLGLFTMPTEPPKGCRCRSFFMRTGFHSPGVGNRITTGCPLAEHV